MPILLSTLDADSASGRLSVDGLRLLMVEEICHNKILGYLKIRQQREHQNVSEK